MLKMVFSQLLSLRRKTVFLIMAIVHSRISGWEKNRFRQLNTGGRLAMNLERQDMQQVTEVLLITYSDIEKILGSAKAEK